MNEKTLKSSSLESIKLAYELLLIRVPSIKHLKYIDQANLVNSEFDSIHATEKDMEILDSPSIYDEEFDLRLQMSNLFNINREEI